MSTDNKTFSAEDQVKDLKLQLNKANENLATVTVELNQAKEDMSSLTKERDDILKINEKLTLEVEKLSSGKGKEKKASVPVTDINLKDFKFKNGGITYGFNWFKITHKGVALTAAEIAKDETIQNELIANKSGMLKVL
ncbi:MAG: hypothetical protein M0Q26_05975 [Chitinophagaceae bacterium]|nr:hypothetical protein [Chitinophagaceae bacterium]MDP1763431.1 hypothetical protein [Sediminibacterium sp.]